MVGGRIVDIAAVPERPVYYRWPAPKEAGRTGPVEHRLN
jgi:hypothetical protein